MNVLFAPLIGLPLVIAFANPYPHFHTLPVFGCVCPCNRSSAFRVAFEGIAQNVRNVQRCRGEDCNELRARPTARQQTHLGNWPIWAACVVMLYASLRPSIHNLEYPWFSCDARRAEFHNVAQCIRTRHRRAVIVPL